MGRRRILNHLTPDGPRAISCAPYIVPWIPTRDMAIFIADCYEVDARRRPSNHLTTSLFPHPVVNHMLPGGRRNDAHVANVEDDPSLEAGNGRCGAHAADRTVSDNALVAGRCVVGGWLGGHQRAPGLPSDSSSMLDRIPTPATRYAPSGDQDTDVTPQSDPANSDPPYAPPGLLSQTAVDEYGPWLRSDASQILTSPKVT